MYDLFFQSIKVLGIGVGLKYPSLAKKVSWSMQTFGEESVQILLWRAHFQYPGTKENRLQALSYRDTVSFWTKLVKPQWNQVCAFAGL